MTVVGENASFVVSRFAVTPCVFLGKAVLLNLALTTEELTGRGQDSGVRVPRSTVTVVGEKASAWWNAIVPLTPFMSNLASAERCPFFFWWVPRGMDRRASGRDGGRVGLVQRSAYVSDEGFGRYNDIRNRA